MVVVSCPEDDSNMEELPPTRPPSMETSAVLGIVANITMFKDAGRTMQKSVFRRACCECGRQNCFLFSKTNMRSLFCLLLGILFGRFLLIRRFDNSTNFHITAKIKFTSFDFVILCIKLSD